MEIHSDDAKDWTELMARTSEQEAEILRLQSENKTLFEEHRIAMNLLRENTTTLEAIVAERDKWKQAYEDAKSLAVMAIGNMR